MNKTISIKCDLHTFEKIKGPLATLRSPVVYSEVCTSYFSKGTTLILVIDNPTFLKNLKEKDLQDFHRVFLIIKKSNSSLIQLPNEILVKTNILYFNENPLNCLKNVVGQLLADERALASFKKFLLKSIEAGLSHQINNPLTIALGFTNKIKKYSDDPNLEADLVEIDSALIRIKDSINHKLPKFLKETSGRLSKKYSYLE